MLVCHLNAAHLQKNTLQYIQHLVEHQVVQIIHVLFPETWPLHQPGLLRPMFHQSQVIIIQVTQMQQFLVSQLTMVFGVPQATLFDMNVHAKILIGRPVYLNQITPPIQQLRQIHLIVMV